MQGGSGHGERDREGGARKPGAPSPHRGPCGDAATGDQQCSCSHLDHSARWCLNQLSRWGSCAGRPLDWHVAPDAPNKGSGPLKPLTIHSKARFFAAVAAVAAMAMPAVADAKSRAPEITVMTRNVFLGADLAPAIDATERSRQAIDGAGVIWNEMQSTRFAGARRAARARDQAVEGRPRRPAGGGAVAQADAVGRRRAADQPDRGREARHRGRAGLPRDPAQRSSSRGAKYRVVVVQEEFDAELPVDVDGSDATGTGPLASLGADFDARLTMRDVILVRKRQQGEARQDAHRATSRRGTSRTSAAIVIPVDRGWASVEALAPGQASSASSTPTSRRSATRRSARRRPRS